MSKLMINASLLPLKTVINAYTASTLPFYYLYQRPWQRLRKAKVGRVQKTVDRHGRIVYSRPAAPNLTHRFYQYKTVSEVLDTLDRSKISIGHREVISEKVELDEKGKPIRIDGKELKKIELSKDFKWQSVGELVDRTDALARGFREMGIKRGDKVLIYADNSLEWFYTSLALTRLNAVVVTLFSTLGDDGVVYGINQSEVRFVITSQDLLPRLNRISDKLQNLESIVYIANKWKQAPELVAKMNTSLQALKGKFNQVKSLDDALQIGSQIAPCKFELPSEDDVALIMYTSGTTGNPKGVILTHRHLQASLLNMLKMDEEFDLRVFNSTFATYLPMAHLFGYVINLGIFSTTNKMALCSPFTLLDSSQSHVPGQVGDLSLFKPQVIFSVPLVLERIIKEIYRKLESRSPIAAPLFTYLMDYKIRWTARGFDTPIINRLVCKRINEQFGGNLNLIGVSSAPLHQRTQALAQAALNITLIQGYGATEACGGTHAMNVYEMSLGRCGAPYSGIKSYLENWDEGGYYTTDKPNPRGEIIVGGDSIALGYYKNEEETKQAFYVDEDGVRWFRTGDIGEIFPDGTIKIIDRKKDLTKLANGEFVSLGKIESGLRATKYVENICICTDPYSNHITALISPNRRAILDLAHKLSKQHLTIEQLFDDPEVISSVLDSLRQTCQKLDFNAKEVPVHITLVKEEWSPENNLLTAAMKLRRKIVCDFYKTQIADMFARSK